jgi:hypothetical protein
VKNFCSMGQFVRLFSLPSFRKVICDAAVQKNPLAGQ